MDDWYWIAVVIFGGLGLMLHSYEEHQEKMLEIQLHCQVAPSPSPLPSDTLYLHRSTK